MKFKHYKHTLKKRRNRNVGQVGHIAATHHYNNDDNYGNNNNFNNNNDNDYNNAEIEYTLTDLLPTQQPKTDMKNELKNFLKKQMNKSDESNNTTPISALDSMMSNSYSEFR